MFRQHLDMINNNESITKKAAFWSSYIKSLKGSEELKAKDSEKHKTNIFDPFSKYPTDEFRTCYDENSTAAERIKRPGYHYETLMRDIYGRSPRNLH